MKKLLYVLVIFSFAIHCQDILQEAILKGDVKEVEKILLTTSLSECDKAVYLNFVDKRIEKINTWIFFNDFFVIYHSIYGGVGMIGAFLCGIGGGFMVQKGYSYGRDGIAPIACLIAGFAASVLCLVKADSKEVEYKAKLQESVANAIRIRQHILNA